MGERINISSASPWEDVVGYSRAVKVGNAIFVSGCTGTDQYGNVTSDDSYEQAKICIEKIEAALVEAGASLGDVVRTRMYVTDIRNWDAVGRAHAEFFRAVKPAATMVEVSRLVGDGLLVEIEADALISSS